MDLIESLVVNGTEITFSILFIAMLLYVIRTNDGTFTNTSSEGSKITITLNGADILYDYEVASGSNEVVHFNIVLESGDIVYIKQSVSNAVNVSLNGSIG